MVGSAERYVEATYAEHRSSLVRWLTAMTRDAVTAEDIAQEAFLRLAREAAAGRSPDDAGAWLHRVAGNLVASRGRHQAVVDRRAGELPTPQPEDGPDLVAEWIEVSVALREALERLPIAHKSALVMAAHGYRGPEIARRLGRTDGATRTLLCRARAKMRLELSARGFAGG
jgi:RNA polymerase sigma-70 factor (ECF subfamily)